MIVKGRCILSIISMEIFPWKLTDIFIGFPYNFLKNFPLNFSRECLKLIPHGKFSFAKIWLLAAQFEIRQLNLKGARQILGNAIGKAPKDKVM